MVRILLHSSVRKIALLAGLGLPAALFTYCSLRVAAAEHYALQGTESSVRRAVQLQPSQAEYHYQLGRTLFAIDQDWDQSASELRKAISLNPRDPRYWLELSTVEHVRGNLEQQESALQQALQADPTTPDVAWEAANLCLVSDRTEDALKLFHVVIQNDPVNAPRAVDLAWRATKNIDSVLQYAVPNTSKAYALLLANLAEQEELAAAQRVWDRLVALNDSVDRRPALKYIDLLLSKKDSKAAARAWDQLTSINYELRGYKTGQNLIVNASFEQDLLNGGLDWRWSKLASGFTTSIDSTQAHTGAYSLLFDMNSRRTDDLGLLQYVPLAPNTAYRFRGFMRSEELLTASGPRFVLSDAETNAVLLTTNEIIGTVQWQDYSAEFVTGPQTRLIKIQLQRFPGDQIITGKFWVDDLELTIR